MDKKQQLMWENIAKQLQTVWSDVVQTAVYNTGLSTTGSLVVVLKDDSIDEIVKAHKIIKDLRKRGVDLPLIISSHYIEQSLDSFPLEFLNIKTDYINLYHKEDIFAKLQFDKNYIRLEMERELKSKELLIKMTVLDFYGSTKHLRDLITVSFQSIEPILKGLLFLLDKEVPKERKELIYQADEATDFDIGSLLIAADITTNDKKLSKDELSPFFDKYTKELEHLSDYIEQFKVT